MKREWFHAFDDDLWIHRSERAHEAAFLAKALNLRRGSRVLDAPCGEGGVSIELARRGIEVTGIDFRDVAVARARAAFAAEQLPGRFVVADLREIRAVAQQDGEFDAAFNWYGSFGYFATDAENLEALRALAGAVRRGGRVLVDQPNREKVLRNFVARSEKSGVRCDSRWDARTERAESVWRLVGRRGFRPKASSIRLFTPAQLREMFDAAGLDVVRLWGHWEGATPWTRSTRRTIVVGRRR